MPKIKLKTGYYKDGKIIPAGEVVEVTQKWLDKNKNAGEVVSGDEKPQPAEAQMAPPDAPPEIADEPGAVFSPPVTPAPKPKRGRKAKAKS